MNPFEQRIAAMVGAICRGWQRRELRRFAAVGAVGLTAWLLAMIALDNLAMLSSGQLLAGWGVLLAAAVVLVTASRCCTNRMSRTFRTGSLTRCSLPQAVRPAAT